MKTKVVFLTLNLIVAITIVFLLIHIKGLQKQFEIVKENNKEIKEQNFHYFYSLNQILETNVSNESFQICVKINDYGCGYCTEKLMTKLRDCFDNENLQIVVNSGAFELYNTLCGEGYNVLIDSLENFNFKVVDPVIFLCMQNNKFLFPYSPDINIAPELFDLYIRN